MGSDPFPFGFPLQLKREMEEGPPASRGKVGSTPVVVLLRGRWHCKVMFPDGAVRVVPTSDVWVEESDA